MITTKKRNLRQLEKEGPNETTVFLVTKEDYSCESKKDEAIFAKSNMNVVNWYENARYRPSAESVHAMTFDELLMWKLINSGQNVLVSGKAGAGKSHLLQRFVNHAKTANFKFRICAPTGVAAFTIGGQTIHKCLNMGLAEDSPVDLWNRIKGPSGKQRFRKTWDFLTCDLWYMDEISMVHPDFFLKLDYLAQKANNNSAPFGGIRLIMSGDFTQIGPIFKKKNKDPLSLYMAENGVDISEEKEDLLVFETESWKRMKLSRVILNRSYRQKTGDFLTLLDHIRKGYMSPDDETLIMSRIDAPMDIASKSIKAAEEKYSHTLESGETISPGIDPIWVFSKNSKVDSCNMKHLEALQRKGCKMVHERPMLYVAKRDHVEYMDPREQRAAQELIKKGKPYWSKQFPIYDLYLCEGCQVMMRKNTFIGDGVYNGSLGWIVSIDNDTIDVLFLKDGEFMDAPISIKREEFSMVVGKTTCVTMKQFPLSVAYAFTIHRCQGLTLDAMHLDASDCFNGGMLYVAISRVRKIEDLVLSDFDSSSLIVNERAVAYETYKGVAPVTTKRHKNITC